MVDFEKFLRAVAYQESRGDPNATSPVGARGLFQIMPATAKDPGFGVDPVDPDQLYDPEVNEGFARQYAQAMLNRYDGDMERALAAYNWGAGNADKWDGDHNKLPRETRDYIKKISSSYASDDFDWDYKSREDKKNLKVEEIVLESSPPIQPPKEASPCPSSPRGMMSRLRTFILSLRGSR